MKKYKFEWKGKSECLRLAQKRSTGTLRPCREESVNFDDTQNVNIEGDNLEVLKLLQTAYYNKVKMIYIDPPYNTGNDFVYEDDFAYPMARYKEITLVFKLDTSNLKLWDNTPITGDNQISLFLGRMNSMIDNIKDDRTDMDVVYEIMLKMGVPLDVPVNRIQLGVSSEKLAVNEEIRGANFNNSSSLLTTNYSLKKPVYVVGDFLLMIALFDDITADDIEAIAAYAPAKIVCAEQSFKDDTALSNAHYILRDKQIELKLV